MLTSKLRPELQGLSQSGGHVRRPFAGDQPQTGLRPPRRGARPLAATPGSVPRVHGRIQRPRSCSPEAARGCGSSAPCSVKPRAPGSCIQGSLKNAFMYLGQSG